jgi:hypothetical protein
VKPMPYEIYVGWGADRKVTHIHSRTEADQVYERMRKLGKNPALFLGELHIKGEQ